MNDNQTATTSPPDWRQRIQQLREQQWSLAQLLLASIRRTLLLHTQRMSATDSLAQADRLLRLAAHLGRLSSEFAAAEADTDYECPKCCASRMQSEAALAKAYGHPLPEESPPSRSQPSTLNAEP